MEFKKKKMLVLVLKFLFAQRHVFLLCICASISWHLLNLVPEFINEGCLSNEADVPQRRPVFRESSKLGAFLYILE